MTDYTLNEGVALGATPVSHGTVHSVSPTCSPALVSHFCYSECRIFCLHLMSAMIVQRCRILADICVLPLQTLLSTICYIVVAFYSGSIAFFR